MESLSNEAMEMLNKELNVVPEVTDDVVKVDISMDQPKMTKGERIAVGVCIGGAALSVIEAGVILLLVKRNGGIKAAFSKKDDDFDDDEYYLDEDDNFDDDEEEEEKVVENKEEKEKKEKK